ncbi:MAG: hypothetical protein EZS26_002871 [Candidatus Ordinivivax streblomastigis]|uniref:Uncharacterized protein n=1 Tax=Candidatus Ordinivivax streblomastigis TaxID=2540710 RepID=A0A5M8NYN1_9BACT|nr:MAG: hypothetical protein EZS26_002871 [Candidatus Ordinivivax streblomastigis]
MIQITVGLGLAPNLTIDYQRITECSILKNYAIDYQRNTNFFSSI